MNSCIPDYAFTLLDAAVYRVQQFDLPFAKTIWQVSNIATRRRLDRLTKRGLLNARTVFACQPPSVTEPLCFWNPGEPIPHAGKISYQARKRWNNTPVQLKRVFYATKQARELMGRPPVAPPKSHHATHDLGLAATFLEYRRRWPKLTASCWLNENEYAHSRGDRVKVEDAMLCRNNRVLRLVDYAGQYRPDRVQSLLNHARTFQTPIAIY